MKSPVIWTWFTVVPVCQWFTNEPIFWAWYVMWLLTVYVLATDALRAVNPTRWARG